MSLLENWRNAAYGAQADERTYAAFWSDYFKKETEFYKALLTDELEKKLTVQALADRFDVSLETAAGFLDGIQTSLTAENPLETMEADTEVSLEYDREKLYQNMVTAKADWLYGLPEWDSLLTEERRAELYRAGKLANTVIKGKKIGRNDPCPCGSGKKYKFCHGRNA